MIILSLQYTRNFVPKSLITSFITQSFLQITFSVKFCVLLKLISLLYCNVMFCYPLTCVQHLNEQVLSLHYMWVLQFVKLSNEPGKEISGY